MAHKWFPGLVSFLNFLISLPSLPFPCADQDLAVAHLVANQIYYQIIESGVWNDNKQSETRVNKK